MTLGLGVLSAVAVLGVIVATIVVFLQRGPDRPALSLGSLLRAYFYLASLAGVIVFAAGLAGVLSYGLVAAFGVEIIYGASPSRSPLIELAPGQPDRLYTFGLDAGRVPREVEDLVRGVTFVVFGAAFWGAHWGARRATASGDDVLHRAYLILGTVTFGIGTVALLPFGVYEILSFLIVPAPAFYRQGAGEALSYGLAALAIWIAYLVLVFRTQRKAS